MTEKNKKLTQLDEWIDNALSHKIPEMVVAFCFNLYDDCHNNWSVELVGCASFDEDDEDWGCDEVTDFGTRENCYRWNEKTDWKHILSEVKHHIGEYLNHGKNADILTSRNAVGIGFVDGDLEVVYKK